MEEQTILQESQETQHQTQEIVESVEVQETLLETETENEKGEVQQDEKVEEPQIETNEKIEEPQQTQTENKENKEEQESEEEEESEDESEGEGEDSTDTSEEEKQTHQPDQTKEKEKEPKDDEEALNWQWRSIVLIIRTFLVFVALILISSYFIQRYQSDPATVQFYWDRYTKDCCGLNDTVTQHLSFANNSNNSNFSSNVCLYGPDYQCDRSLNLWLYSKGIGLEFLPTCCYWYGKFGTNWWSVQSFCRADCLNP